MQISLYKSPKPRYILGVLTVDKTELVCKEICCLRLEDSVDLHDKRSSLSKKKHRIAIQEYMGENRLVVEYIRVLGR